MNEIIHLVLSLPQGIQEVKTRIELLRLSRAELLKDTWNDNLYVLQNLHISMETLKTLRKNGTLTYKKVKGKFYYKVSDIENLFQRNYYNPNFKCDGIK
jgi:hypothetical protein